MRIARSQRLSPTMAMNSVPHPHSFESPCLITDSLPSDNGLQRGLKPRHLTMISFGGVVGASVWYGVGFAIAYSGPVGALLCFLIVGVDVFFVMQCLGEMSTLFPVQGAFVSLAGRFADESLAFSLGWNYWYLWVCNVAGDFNNSSVSRSGDRRG